MSADVTHCIAMSEDGFRWFAFPKAMTRGRVMAALARNMTDIGYGDWHDFLTHYRIRAGHIRPEPYEHSPDGWWSECAADDPQAEPCWIVKLIEPG